MYKYAKLLYIGILLTGAEEGSDDENSLPMGSVVKLL
jgi:hypothetical protein